MLLVVRLQGGCSVTSLMMCVCVMCVERSSSTSRPPLPAPGRCCFLSGRGPGGRSQSDDLEASQTHDGTSLSEENTHTHTKVMRLAN